VIGILAASIGLGLFVFADSGNGTQPTFETDESIKEFKTYHNESALRDRQNLTHVILTHSGGDKLPYPQLRLSVNGSDSAIGCKTTNAGAGDPCSLSSDVSGYTPSPLVAPQPNVCKAPPADSPNLLTPGDKLNVFAYDSLINHSCARKDIFQSMGGLTVMVVPVKRR
jgi:hypothetical protein